MKSVDIKTDKEVKIGHWSYNSSYGRLKNKNGDEYFIEFRLNKLFHILILKREFIVKRDDLIDFVWREVQVNEENLTKGIFDLRKLLKKLDINDIEIKTIRNVGYQLKVKEKESKAQDLKKVVLKVSIYTIIVISFLILFIRAMRYEN